MSHSNAPGATPPSPFATLREALSNSWDRDWSVTAEALSAGHDVFPDAPSSLMDIITLEGNVFSTWEERLATGEPLGVEEVTKMLADVDQCWMAVAAIAAGRLKG